MDKIKAILRRLLEPHPGYEEFRHLAPASPDRMDDHIRPVFLRLMQLKRLDRECFTHGTWKHRYDCQPMSPTRELEPLEQSLGCRLPDECRRWLLQVGIAGPDYGLDLRNPGADPWGVGSDPRDQGESDLASAWRLLDGVDNLTDELVARALAADSGPRPYQFCLRSYDGMLQLAESGCGAAAFLITRGPQTGRVVHDWILAANLLAGGVGVFGPAYGTKDGKAPSFLQWVDAWVDRSLTDLPRVQEFERQRRQQDR